MKNGTDFEMVSVSSAGSECFFFRERRDGDGKLREDLALCASAQVRRRFVYRSDGEPEFLPREVGGSEVTVSFSSGSALSVERDAFGRKIRTIDSFEGMTEYEYSSEGRLLREVCDAGTDGWEIVNSVSYRKDGEIDIRNGKRYGYSAKNGLPVSVGDDTILYAKNGSVSEYLGHFVSFAKRKIRAYDGAMYEYAPDGTLSALSVGSTRVKTTFAGDVLLCATWDGHRLIPLYGGSGATGILFDGEPFLFLRDDEGSVIGIRDGEGRMVARYAYGAFGECRIRFDRSESSVATLNPFRFRGEVCDPNSGFYRRKNGYYDPETALTLPVCGSGQCGTV